jgi:acyl carrier protein
MQIILNHNSSFFAMDTSAVKNEVKNIFLSVFPEINETEFSWDDTITEYENWDSFAHLRLVSQIEKKFEIQLDLDDAINLNSASDFLKLTQKMLNSS